MGFLSVLKKWFAEISLEIKKQQGNYTVDVSETVEDMPEIEDILSDIEIPRMEAAQSYNKTNVPIFAPDGFPSECGCVPVDLNRFEPGSEEFAKSIGSTQKSLGLSVDGFCGPNTIEAVAKECLRDVGGNAIVVGPKAIVLPQKVVTTYLDDPDLGGLNGRRRNTKVTQMVLHYDVTFSAMSTVSVLKNRNLSYHFLIDGDEKATIYQLSNPTLHVAYHAGPANNNSIGICINNPADPKYREMDARRRGRERGVSEDVVHGKKRTLLNFFDSQIVSADDLIAKLHLHLQIPRVVQRDEEGTIRKDVCYDPEVPGLYGHYHISATKIDPAPLDWNKLTLDE